MIYLKKVINVLSIVLCVFGLILMFGIAGRMETDVSYSFHDGMKLMFFGLILFAQRIVFYGTRKTI